ncbi:hypothetical protein FQA39_LY07610 [Lamprigera yunnana]|nr:hypothetical protein FQA39_LY07610 [Lamprigera yunnana]
MCRGTTGRFVRAPRVAFDESDTSRIVSLKKYQSQDEEARAVAVPDLQSDVEEDGIIEDFRAEHAVDDAKCSSSEDDIPV